MPLTFTKRTKLKERSKQKIASSVSSQRSPFDIGLASYDERSKIEDKDERTLRRVLLQHVHGNFNQLASCHHGGSSFPFSFLESSSLASKSCFSLEEKCKRMRLLRFLRGFYFVLCIDSFVLRRPIGHPLSQERCIERRSMVIVECDYHERELLDFVDVLLSDTSKASVSKEVILERIRTRHQADFESSLALAAEDHVTRLDESVIPSYDWIAVEDNYSLAIQSLEPVLNASSVVTLRSAADDIWQNSQGRQSRFTYQRPGNYEAHVFDLSSEAKAVVNDCLVQSIYPLIRHAFNTTNETDTRLCVYDALMIRYNATEADASQVAGAGQPFHRDLGIVSINIMLNDASDFRGGGTFFENQLRGRQPPEPLKPGGVGHCLAHYSAERHAGSATLEGVRDILVIFVTAFGSSTPPALVQNAMLKQCRAACHEECETAVDALLCRILHQRLAIQAVPGDGEAWQYLGTALLEYSDAIGLGDRHLVVAAKDCFQHAAILTPCDSRVYSNLALSLGRLSRIPDDSSAVLLSPSIEAAFEQAWTVLEHSETAGCDVARDFDSLMLSYGLHVSKQDRFEDACRILLRVAKKRSLDEKQGEDQGRVVEDAYRLWEFCCRQLKTL
jgi:hypothetical protein